MLGQRASSQTVWSLSVLTISRVSRYSGDPGARAFSQDGLGILSPRARGSTVRGACPSREGTWAFAVEASAIFSNSRDSIRLSLSFSDCLVSVRNLSRKGPSKCFAREPLKDLEKKLFLSCFPSACSASSALFNSSQITRRTLSARWGAFSEVP